MTNHSATTRSSGVGFFALLTIVFVTLKLLGAITWPWGWVLAPLWISVALTVALLLIIGAVALVFAAHKESQR